MRKYLIANPTLQDLENLADLMDTKFIIPGTNIRFGLDAILGLIPGLGDTATLFVTAYLLHHAHTHQLPWHVKGRMIGNAVIDWFIGLVPVIGDLFDVGWKANRRNVQLLRRYGRFQ